MLLVAAAPHPIEGAQRVAAFLIAALGRVEFEAKTVWLNGSVGSRIDIGEYTHIRASGGVTIGDRVLIAAGAVITSREHPVALPR